ncbi:peptide/nickel transport system permease protein [Kytococcus aerolatus]|uniref:Peptide/nickel transport system permease protein n=1 Tax=Kytococcus aerolatus TaxID=592308 RepID=A0A212SZH8_9MICO|nr:ABC transporter permease [Kytococcus aerolatus]SNC59177.1 peptide/nickel transport system permease protein [Kytococcus aerolatus]
MTTNPGLNPTSEAGAALEGDLLEREHEGDVAAAQRVKGDEADRYQSRSPVQIALRRLAYDKVAMMSLGSALLFILLAIFADVINGALGLNPTEQRFDLVNSNGYPIFVASWEHPFGVEVGMGRDLFSRWILGMRPSLIIAFSAAIATTIIGTVMGLLAGFLGGIVDNVISFIIDVVLSLPFLLFAIALMPIATNRIGGVGEGEFVTDEQLASIRFGVLVFVLIMFGWAGLARLIRGEVISIREREYVQAARALGVPTSQILFKEILPNLISPIIVALTTAIPAYIATEAGLSLLGVGLREPSISWGLTIQSAQNSFMEHPIYMWMPVIGLCLLVLSLSLLGDAINDAFNPHTRR